MSAGQFLRDKRLHATTTPAATGEMRDLALQAKVISLNTSRQNNLIKSWLSPDTAPVASIVNDATDYEFLMPGNQTPNLEVPYLIGPDATSIRIVATVAISSHVAMAPLRIKFRTQTLLATVTTATSSVAVVSGTSTIVPSGWRRVAGQPIFAFGTASIQHTPQSLGTSRLQAVGAFARWDVENDNVLESSGTAPLAMDVSVYMMRIEIRDNNMIRFGYIGSL